MKLKQVKITLCLILIVCIAILLPNKVEAMYQSRPNVTSVNGSISSIINVRKMEIAGQVMNLSELISESFTSNMYGTASTSNNIDVHMIKKTEYGGMAMLSASVYGDAPIGINENASTTGNKYGIFQIANSKGEWNASASWNVPSNYFKYSYIKGMQNMPYKYKHTLGSTTGAAMLETQNWYNATSAVFSYNGEGYGIIRGASGMFDSRIDDVDEGYGLRAVIVNGEGI